MRRGRARPKSPILRGAPRRCTFRKAQLLYTYSKLVGEGTLVPCAQLASLLVKKSSKSQSGVLVITVLTSPYPRIGNKVHAACSRLKPTALAAQQLSERPAWRQQHA